MKRIELDFSKCVDRGAVHVYLKEQFGFPDHYGNNLDALYDALGDITEDLNIIFMEEEEGSCGEWVVDGSLAMRTDEMDRLLKNIRRVIEDAAEENGHLHV